MSEQISTDLPVNDDEFNNIEDEPLGADATEMEQNESVPEPVLEEVEHDYAGAMLMVAKVLSTAEVNEKAKENAMKDKHASAIMDLGNNASQLVTKTVESLKGKIDSQTSKLSSSSTEAEEKVSFKVKAGTTSGAYGMQLAAQAAGISSKIYNTVCGAAGTWLSNILYTKHADFMRKESVVKVKTIFISVLSVLILMINTVFDGVGNLVNSLIQLLVAAVTNKKGAQFGNVVGNVAKILVYGFQLYLALSLMGLKGIIITFAVLFVVGVITKIEDIDEKKPAKVDEEASSQPQTASSNSVIAPSAPAPMLKVE
ncbi:uncharacterized protein MONOS_2282 [Monocercomonoides exilis]|uniref:uncharacterized protein n=1 Tax=Monocercomonoides exilis TaxID=2049356 RepID=UPI00355A9827|nr:hypothetical protein MONOS_2282 [Monocercomonoides exilis]|eukprot:MONOS_2282.1-p1 / transcript=MONOS_2282.1 / gene=MONOS_2282 / organism=Monocercomonoides_exilis_PA203 / gene_product=unspecified product / transcript_product=unspecified product / location=Mono_scaffold00046:72058-73112(-) / protein_length=313 / sequence_SO=supercontig / SO=protein_coding / is_pseudo=false